MPAALVLLFFFLPSGALEVPLPALALLVLGGLGPGAVAGISFFRGLARLEASRASVLMLLEPLTAVLVGIVVWHEAPRPLGVVGAALVLAGAYWVLRGGATHARAA